MKEFINKNKYVISIIILITILYLLIFGICSFNMMAQDEYNYSNIAWTSNRIDSFSDILTSMKRLYLNWTGRLPALGMVQVFLYLGVAIYDIINPLIFIAFILLICKVTGKKVSLLSTSSIVLLSVVASPKFWEKFIWMSGSLNYLWPVTLMLGVMYYFYNYIINDKKVNKKESILLFITSFLAGWSHENTVFVLGSFIIIICLVNYKKILKFEKRKLITITISILLFGIGAMLLIFAPGNFLRMNSSETTINIINLLKTLYMTKITFLIYIATIIAMLKNKSSILENKKDIIKQFIYFLLPCGIGLIPMLIIPEFPSRAMLAYETCLYICIANNIFILKKQYENKTNVIKLFTYLIVIMCIISLGSKALYTYKYIKPYKEKLINQIEQSKIHGQKDIIVSEFDNLVRAEKIGVYMDVFPKKLNITIANSYMAMYYGVNSITALKDGYVILEVVLESEDNIINYNAIDKNTGEIIASRIISTDLMMPNLNVKNRIIFQIPKEKIDDIIVNLPKGKIIKEVLLKDLTETKNINIESIIGEQ